ncbi:CPBP family intramembrane glutamic endopeptidase [Amphibacillus sp. Q70]|uniref:CPBP family intramembrane glutamic endopeptidase n=1 Tax=Amphibacillus sp. Q70 TaxID=3453416 RepID=UPI003F84B0B7
MKKQVSLLVTVSFLVLLMAPIDLWLAPNYWVKSWVKIILFVITPIVLNRKFDWFILKDLLLFKKKGRKQIFFFGIVIYLFIILCYWTLGSWFDFSGVIKTLEKTMAIDKDNFIGIALYIPVVNAFIEEFFFRGVIFLTLKRLMSPIISYLLSAGIFAVYHVAIMTNWFTLPLFILVVFSLVIAGLLFNWITDKTGSIYASYFVHATSNLAINTIALHLFGLLF